MTNLNAVQSKLVQQYWVVDETLTDYYRPADQSMYSADALFTSYPTGQTRWALLVNGAAFIGTSVSGRLCRLARRRKAFFTAYCCFELQRNDKVVNLLQTPFRVLCWRQIWETKSRLLSRIFPKNKSSTCTGTACPR